MVLALPQGGQDRARPAKRNDSRGLLLLCTCNAFTLRAEQTKGFISRSLIKHSHTHTHTHTPHLEKERERGREKEEERKEREGCVWHYSAAPKIAPWRPGLQLGCHGDRTTGAINRQSAPNLVRLEWGQKEGETDRERERNKEHARQIEKEKKKEWQKREKQTKQETKRYRERNAENGVGQRERAEEELQERRKREQRTNERS